MSNILRVASDLHLEGFLGRDIESLAVDFLPRDERDASSILVLAGDISSDTAQLIGFIGAVENRFKKVIFVPGNHELYKHNFQAWNVEMSDRASAQLKNTAFTDSEMVECCEIAGTRFIFGTMWADGGPTLADQGQVGYYLNDFRLISYNDNQHLHVRRMRVPDMVYIFKKSKDRISEILKVPFDGKTVVITHHLPSRRLVSARFWPTDGSDGANGGFVGDCDSILAGDYAPDLWIHGHTHDTVDTTLWKTRVVCNPAGYRGEWVSNFNTYMIGERRDDGTVRAVALPKFVEL